eukprot:TRINITY_DN4165_c0_g1_i1.p2 TRINITY_DN4165_c0_g1~~TRINITY_DN4165_c0_g1_i1.p2  ORF type:complete len:134 (+),score=33.35 TRINITY_DN4165_c0_g1_i1:73-474(+)
MASTGADNHRAAIESGRLEMCADCLDMDASQDTQAGDDENNEFSSGSFEVSQRRANTTPCVTTTCQEDDSDSDDEEEYVPPQCQKPITPKIMEAMVSLGKFDKDVLVIARAMIENDDFEAETVETFQARSLTA